MELVNRALASATPLLGTRNIRCLHEAPGSSVLALVMDLSTSLGASSSGKTELLASSSGNKPLGTSGAMMGLNAYCKSLDKRNLAPSATDPLKDLSEIKPGMSWCVREGKYLVMLLDFTKAETKTASSEKSVLLLSTGGNKALGATGVNVGVNIYHPVGKHFVATGLNQLGKVGGADFDMQVAEDGVTTTVLVPLAEGAAAKSVKNISTEISDTLRLNATITGSPAAKADDDAADAFTAVPGAFNLEISVRPTMVALRFRSDLESGFSSTGKTILVANSGGGKVIQGLKVQFLVYKKSDDKLLEVVTNVFKGLDNPLGLSFKRDFLPKVLAVMGGLTELSPELTSKVKEFVRQQAESATAVCIDETPPSTLTTVESSKGKDSTGKGKKRPRSNSPKSTTSD